LKLYINLFTHISEHDTVLVLMSLNRLFLVNTTIRQKGVGQWRPSRQEIIEGFILHIKVISLIKYFDTLTCFVLLLFFFISIHLIVCIDSWRYFTSFRCKKSKIKTLWSHLTTSSNCCRTYNKRN